MSRANLLHCDTVDTEILNSREFARILFSRIALKYILAALKIRD